MGGRRCVCDQDGGADSSRSEGWRGPAAERELFDRFNASARHWGNRLGVDTEDLLQDTAVEFYATLSRQRDADGPRPGLNGRTVKPADRPAAQMANPGGWIHRISYNIAARRVAGTNSSADLSALREYRTRVQDAENRSGGALSAAEADRLADEIRMTRPPRRRPTPGFHRKVRTVSTEALGPDWDTPAESNPLDDNEFPAHSAGAAAENLLDGNGSPGRSAARRLAWDAVADVTGAPVVVPEVIDPGTSRQAARLVSDAGGATAVSRHWAKDPQNPAVTALFTPFGRLEIDEQQAVIRTIHRSGGYGDQVWSAALRAATYRQGRRAG